MSNSNLVSVNIPAYAGNYTKGRSGRRIEAITIHHMAGILSAEQCGKVFQRVGRNGSSHYGIGSDGRIGQYVDESNTAWTNSNWDSNCKSVTIETSNCEIGGQWKVSDNALNSLIRLVADIAKRNNLGTLVRGKNLTWHRMFCATTCPGDYLLSKIDYIIAEANKINGGGQPTPTPTPAPDYTGTITYQAYDGKWEKEVYKADNSPDGYAGDSIHFISGVRAKPQYGEIIIEAHELGGQWLGPVSSKNYKTNDMMDGNSYAGVYGKPQDAYRIKSTRGYVKYRCLVKINGKLKWLDWVIGFGDKPNEYAGIFGMPIYGIQME